jgi:hypothetical protein
MPGFDGQVVWASNIDFSDPMGIAFSHSGGITTAGALFIGTGVAPPGVQIAPGAITGSGGVIVSYSSPNINIDGSGAGTATTYTEDAGTATPAANILNIVGAGGITTAGAGNTITITGSASFTWTNISASQTLAIKNGYFCSGGGALALLLPVLSAVGDTIEIVLIGSTSFTVTQSAGQQIKLGNTGTTPGVGGSLASTQQGDAIRIICQTANLTWVVAAGSMGNLTII